MASSARSGASVDRPKPFFADKPFFFWLTLLLVAALSVIYALSGWIIYRDAPISGPIGWRAHFENGEWAIAYVDQDGPAAGKLIPGDRVIAFNGDRRLQLSGPRVFEDFLAPGSSYSLNIVRQSHEQEVSLGFPKSRDPYALSSNISYLIVSLSFFAVAALLGLSRPEERTTQLGCLTCMGVALRLLPLALWSYQGMGSLENNLTLIADYQDPWHLVLGYLFYCSFSANLLRERFWRILRWALSVAGALFFTFLFPLLLAETFGRDSVLSFATEHPWFMRGHFALYANGARDVFELIALMLMCAAIAASYFRVKDADQQRRVRWVVFGSVAGLSPILLYDLAMTIMAWAGWGDLRRIWFTGQDIVNLSLILIPFATGYAVLRHRAMGISVVFRQSMKYLLARNVLQLILLLPVVGLVLPVVRHPNRTVSELFFQNSMYLNLILLALLGLGLKYRVQVRGWVDRKFFREAYNQERILRELIGRIKEVDSISEISRLVSHEVEAALHPSCLRVFYREKETSDLTLGYSSGAGPSEMRIQDTARILQVLERNRRPVDFPLSGHLELPAEEREWLEQLETHLIVPITGGRHRLMGVLLLGGKRSEEPYTPTDRNLLEAIAAQMGVVYERSWLQDQVGEEQRIKHDVLAHLEHSDVKLLRECARCGACFDSTARTCDKDGSELTVTLPVERIIGQKYRLDQRIGRGGMGAVYEGTDLRLNRKIAIKVMVGSLFGNREALRRFEREARASALLNHPNIVAIHDFGMVGQDGAYLVMERIYGTTWRAELDRRGALMQNVAPDWFQQLLSGLRAAHEAGVAHRDLKPENVLISARDDKTELIKILDFGLAKMRFFGSGETQSITMAGGILGTLGYMSPEQLSGTESDERSDIFSVGVMAFETITGRRPFEGSNYAEVLNAMLKGPGRVPGDGPEISALNSVLAKCLASDPNARFRTVAEMQRPLVDALRVCPPVERRREEPGHVPTRSLGASRS